MLFNKQSLDTIVVKAKNNYQSILGRVAHYMDNKSNNSKNEDKLGEIIYSQDDGINNIWLKDIFHLGKWKNILLILNEFGAHSISLLNDPNIKEIVEKCPTKRLQYVLENFQVKSDDLKSSRLYMLINDFDIKNTNYLLKENGPLKISMFLDYDGYNLLKNSKLANLKSFTKYTKNIKLLKKKWILYILAHGVNKNIKYLLSKMDVENMNQRWIFNLCFKCGYGRLKDIFVMYQRFASSSLCAYWSSWDEALLGMNNIKKLLFFVKSFSDSELNMIYSYFSNNNMKMSEFFRYLISLNYYYYNKIIKSLKYKVFPFKRLCFMVVNWGKINKIQKVMNYLRNMENLLIK